MTRPAAPRRGFSLAEVMIVAAIVGILAALACPSYRRAVEHARAEQAAAHLRTIWAAERLYYLERRSFTADPAALAALGVLDWAAINAAGDYVYAITSADGTGFAATAARAGGGSYAGTLAIDATGVVTGEVDGPGGYAIRPGT